MIRNAKKLNEAKRPGHPPPLHDSDLDQLRHLAAFIPGFADEVWIMADGRRRNIAGRITDEQKHMAALAGQGGNGE